ncbi:hypothetical protein TorRG33x02_340720 [Trema orientale]|uniref:Uncharacterized protein n=1 Tax=Trema orientale TaxID=63057 RepID=A0A2P5AUY8_TREOI|nr:hypothetical protein TorRG33x02_340720 [Trema orientale]
MQKLPNQLRRRILHHPHPLALLLITVVVTSPLNEIETLFRPTSGSGAGVLRIVSGDVLPHVVAGFPPYFGATLGGVSGIGGGGAGRGISVVDLDDDLAPVGVAHIVVVVVIMVILSVLIRENGELFVAGLGSGDLLRMLIGTVRLERFLEREIHGQVR